MIFSFHGPNATQDITSILVLLFIVHSSLELYITGLFRDFGLLNARVSLSSDAVYMMILIGFPFMIPD